MMAEGVQNSQYLLIVFAKVLAKSCLVDALHFDDVGRYGLWSVLVNEALGHVVVDGILGLLVKHQNETFNFLCVLLI